MINYREPDKQIDDYDGDLPICKNQAMNYKGRTANQKRMILNIILLISSGGMKKKQGSHSMKECWAVSDVIKLIRFSRTREQIEEELRDIGHHPKAESLKKELNERLALQSKFEIIKTTENMMRLFFKTYSNYETKKVTEWRAKGYNIETINDRLMDAKQNMQHFFNIYLERIFSKHSHTIPSFSWIEPWAHPLIEGGLNVRDYNNQAEELNKNIKHYSLQKSNTTNTHSFHTSNQREQNNDTKNTIIREQGHERPKAPK